MKIVFIPLLAIANILFLSSCEENKNLDKEVSHKEKEIEEKEIELDSIVIKNTEEMDTLSYYVLDEATVSNFNKTLLQNKITSLEEVANLYAPEDPYAEGKYSYNLKLIEKNDIHTILEIVTEGIMDDSLDGLKIIMEVSSAQEYLQVNSIKEAYKCKEGRGHQNWSSELCL